MSLGKERRLKRIFLNGKTVIIPMDHGVTSGPIKGLTNMQAIIDKLALGEANGIVVHKGIAKTVDTKGLGLIIHLSASTKYSLNPNRKIIICSIKEAVRLGADAISIHINVGDEKEPEMLKALGKIADGCDYFGLPLLAMMYPRGPKISSEHDFEAVAHAARLGAELGADVIKTNYTGSIETFRKVVEGCPVPVVIAGGPKVETSREILQMVYDSLKAGGSGVSIGRNVFQHENPTAMTKALAAIVHKGASVNEALKILGES
ncbi:2-amino-3,7-dideoxy-D-threo-hept-6-ulosonate synthase [Candidatus Bathyarchaeota archaeon]|nr:2-amino-3,7-dideoxy-D-threo-hept-6-ulosonate synthase [Candidatus Bathyarchaeota archaeon]